MGQNKMTVAELIEELKGYKQDAYVMMKGNHNSIPEDVNDKSLQMIGWEDEDDSAQMKFAVVISNSLE